MAKPAAAAREPLVEPWQFFLLAGMLAATATVVVAKGQAPAGIVVLSLTVVAAGLVGLGAYRALVPLVSDEPVAAPALVGGRTRAALEREKALALRAIKELEFDFAMGKMAQVDFDEMSGRLRRRAVGLMRQLDEAGGYREQIARAIDERLGAAGERVSAQPRCACGTVNDVDARFCKQCGAKLA